MKALSDVTLLFSTHARAIERAREIFTSESRHFIQSVVDSLRRTKEETWSANRLRITLDREIDTEAKVTGYFTSQYALGRAIVRFKKETRFVSIADVTFGIAWSDETSAFVWLVSVVSGARYPQLDDVLWREWQGKSPRVDIPGAEHQSKANALRFCARPIDKELVLERASDDVIQVLDFVLSSEEAIAGAVGLVLTTDEEASATPITSAD